MLRRFLNQQLYITLLMLYLIFFYKRIDKINVFQILQRRETNNLHG